jgi:ssDNA thymidine ADP-ribosyltransferase, DarT
MKRTDIKSLYYITHIENLPSILERGIMSHRTIERSGVAYTKIYDGEIVNRRQNKQTPGRGSLWEYANLYFQPRNPMLYRVIHEADKKNRHGSELFRSPLHFCCANGV